MSNGWEGKIEVLCLRYVIALKLGIRLVKKVQTR